MSGRPNGRISINSSPHASGHNKLKYIFIIYDCKLNRPHGILLYITQTSVYPLPFNHIRSNVDFGSLIGVISSAVNVIFAMFRLTVWSSHVRSSANWLVFLWLPYYQFDLMGVRDTLCRKGLNKTSISCNHVQTID